MYAEDDNDRKNVAVVCSGSAADHCNLSMLNFTFYDPKRNVVRLKQAGRGGIGRVFADKHIKMCIRDRGRLHHQERIQRAECFLYSFFCFIRRGRSMNQKHFAWMCTFAKKNHAAREEL